MYTARYTAHKSVCEASVVVVVVVVLGFTQNWNVSTNCSKIPQ
jgi:hypothetical protein